MANSSAFANTISWVGSIIVGVVSVMVIIWVIVALIGKKKTKAKMKKR